MNKASARSLSILLCFFILFSALLIGRLFYLQVIKHPTFKKKSQVQVQKKINIASFRGKILDRNGYPLALSKPSYSLYIAPQHFQEKPENLNKLTQIATILNIKKSKLIQYTQSTQHFIWIQRKMSYETYQKIKALLCRGLYFIEEEKRYYPENTLASDVIGFVGMDGGLGGIEYSQDKLLKGSQGQLIIEGDTQGRPFLSAKASIQGNPKSFGLGKTKNNDYFFDGENIFLTLDRKLQYKTEYYLKKMIDFQEASKGQAIVMDVKTGHVLSLADIPSYNPNTFYRYSQEILKNSTVVDVFEPGSILKPFIYAMGLEQKAFETDTIWDLPESMTVDRRLIREAHKRKPDEASLYTSQQIIEKSLNVGTTQMAFKIGAQNVYDNLKAFGFGSRSQNILPGESAGILSDYQKWSDSKLATISFGQGISVNLLQIASAYCSLANEGKAVKAKIIDKITHDTGVITSQKNIISSQKNIISAETSRKVLTALEATVNEGSGIRAKIPGFRIGGKTGTAQVPDLKTGGYKKGAYISSFVMVLPIEDPQFVIAVAIHEAQKDYYGSRVALPVAKSIAYELINEYNLKPQSETDSLNRKWDPLL